MEAKQTPLIELLEQVPHDARVVVEHDQFSSSSHPVGRLCHEAAAALRARLAQPEQELFCYHDGRNIVGKEYAHHCDVFPLYTHPAAQQPLTDEQFNRIPELYVIPPHHVEMVVRAIEAAHGIGEKLKEKNHG